jgi:hypothetical protein
MKKGIAVGLLALVAALLVFAATASAAPGWNLTLQVSPASVSSNGSVTFTGVLSQDGVGAGPDEYVEVDTYTDSSCNDYAGFYDWNYTNSDGSYSIGPELGSDVLGGGAHYVMAFGWDYGTESWVANSACVPLQPAGNPVNHEFLCYSKWQTQPGVWDEKTAAKLLSEGYWLPTAVDGNVAGGTNVGSYNLQCNVTPKGDGWVGATGTFYSGDWSAYAAANGGLYPH